MKRVALAEKLGFSWKSTIQKNFLEKQFKTMISEYVSFYEVDSTKEQIEVKDSTIDGLNSKLMGSLINRFKGVIPAGKGYGVCQWDMPDEINDSARLPLSAQ